MGRQINPRRIPRTQADCDKAWEKGADFGMTFCIKAFLFCLKDKHDANDADLLQLRDEFCEVVDAYRRGDIKPRDLDSVLEEEFKITIRMA